MGLTCQDILLRWWQVADAFTRARGSAAIDISTALHGGVAPTPQHVQNVQQRNEQATTIWSGQVDSKPSVPSVQVRQATKDATRMDDKVMGSRVLEMMVDPYLNRTIHDHIIKKNPETILALLLVNSHMYNRFNIDVATYLAVSPSAGKCGRRQIHKPGAAFDAEKDLIKAPGSFQLHDLSDTILHAPMLELHGLDPNNLSRKLLTPQQKAEMMFVARRNVETRVLILNFIHELEIDDICSIVKYRPLLKTIVIGDCANLQLRDIIDLEEKVNNTEVIKYFKDVDEPGDRIIPGARKQVNVVHTGKVFRPPFIEQLAKAKAEDGHWYVSAHAVLSQLTGLLFHFRYTDRAAMDRFLNINNKLAQQIEAWGRKEFRACTSLMAALAGWAQNLPDQQHSDHARSFSGDENDTDRLLESYDDIAQDLLQRLTQELETKITGVAHPPGQLRLIARGWCTTDIVVHPHSCYQKQQKKQDNPKCNESKRQDIYAECCMPKTDTTTTLEDVLAPLTIDGADGPYHIALQDRDGIIVPWPIDDDDEVYRRARGLQKRTEHTTVVREARQYQRRRVSMSGRTEKTMETVMGPRRQDLVRSGSFSTSRKVILGLEMTYVPRYFTMPKLPLLSEPETITLTTEIENQSAGAPLISLPSEPENVKPTTEIKNPYAGAPLFAGLCASAAHGALVGQARSQQKKSSEGRETVGYFLAQFELVVQAFLRLYYASHTTNGTFCVDKCLERPSPDLSRGH